MGGFKHFAKGDSIPRSARFYNAVVDQLNGKPNELTEPPDLPPASYTRFKMRNGGNTTIEIYSPCLMTGPIWDPAVGAGLNQGNEMTFAKALPMDVKDVQDGYWRDNSGRPVVALERVTPGKIGWFAINGLVPARVFTNTGLYNYNLGYCFPSYQRFWQVIGVNGSTDIGQQHGYKIVWQSSLIQQAGEWRWCIVDLGDRGPVTQNLFTVHREQNFGGTLSQNASQLRGVLAVPLRTDQNGASHPWGAKVLSGLGTTNWRRPYCQFTTGYNYEFYRDVGLMLRWSGTVQLPKTTVTQTAQVFLEAYIRNDTFSWPVKRLFRYTVAEMAQGSSVSGGMQIPFTAQMYCPAGCYFAPNAAGGNAGRFSVRFEYLINTSGGAAPGGGFSELCLSCDILHENYAAEAGHLYSPAGGGPPVVP